jgi:plasmid maintenance system antidote protein VapI
MPVIFKWVWLNLQGHYDLKMARRDLKPEEAKRIKARRAA